MRPLLFLLLFAATASADGPPVPVVFPDAAAPVTPVVPPKPAPAPKPPAVPVLTPDSIYAVDYAGEAIVIASPPGIVKVTTEAGPVKVKGKFADTGKVETRTFTGKTVITVEAVASGRAELIVIPVGATKAEQVGRKLIDSLTAPIPPPKPVDPPKPKPNAPIAGTGFKALIVFEKQDATKYPPAQWDAVYGAGTRAYLNSKAAIGPDGKTREWRIYDKDTPMDGETSVWIDAMKRPRTSLPWIVLSDGKSGFEGPLPATESEITALLKKWGGN